MSTSVENVKPKRYGWVGSLVDILEQYGDLTSDQTKAAGHLTHTKRAYVLKASFRELRALGYKLDDPRNFKPKHMEALVKKWEEEGQAKATIQNKISVFRVFSRWIGKPGMVRSAEYYVQVPGAASRTYVATTPKGWTANEVSTDLIEKVKAYDARVGIQLEACLVFGLRMQEAIELKPHRADKGDYLAISDGTKGGRDRVLPLDTKEKRELLERCKRLVGHARNAHLGSPERTLAQNKRRFYFVLQKFGITKKDLGVTAHGLRHEYVNKRYQDLGGDKSPIEGGTLARENPKLDHEIREIISEEVGHTRPSIVSCYSGSIRTVKKNKGEEENKDSNNCPQPPNTSLLG